MAAFKITDPTQQQMINARLLERISHLEQRTATKRLKEKRSMIGRDRLIAEPLSLSYRPKRSGKRMWCLSDKRSLRISFITFFKKLMATARAVRERWRQGDTSVRYPPGLFPPSMPKLANVFRAQASIHTILAFSGKLGGRVSFSRARALWLPVQYLFGRRLVWAL